MQEVKRFGVEVNFLTGRYVATSHDDRRQPEWPPHPARLFSALVATWADSDEPRGDERDVLEWLEAQGPPGIVAGAEAIPRRVVSHYVPVNDTAIVGAAWYRRRAEDVLRTTALLDGERIASAGEATRKTKQLQNKLAKQRDVTSQVSAAGNTNVDTAQKLLPKGRDKRERHFPSVTLVSPRVTFVWDRDLPEERCDVLDGLLVRLTRLGHSSSLVSCRLVRDAPDANLLPSRTGTKSLRHVRDGQIAELERRFTQHQGITPRALPYTNVRYSKEDDQTAVAEDTANTVGDWIIFEFLHGSRAYPASRTVEVATTLRSAIFSYADDPLPEGLSGHTPDGGPTSEPHVAFVPLPFAGYRHGNGRLLGLALSVPHSVDKGTRRALYRAIGKWEKDAGRNDPKLVFGHQGELCIRRLRGSTSPSSLHLSKWRGPGKRWASVTPIALPRHPGRLRGGTPSARARAWRSAEAAVRMAVTHLGLPEPSATQVSLAPFLVGARRATAFPPFRQPDRRRVPVRRQLVHAVITFDRPVRGPMMLGAGRFLGLGLMHPLPVQETPASGRGDQ